MSLFAHSWKSSVRSILWGRELASNIFLGAILALLALNLLGLGLFIRPLLQELYPGEDPVALVNGVLLTWLALDLILRIFLQKIPSLEVLPYLLLPFPRRRIIRFMLVRMLLSGFNFVPLFAIIPVLFTLYIPERGTIPSFAWLFGVAACMLATNVIVFIIDKAQARRIRTIPLVGISLGTLLVLTWFGTIDIISMSTDSFGSLLEDPWTIMLWCAAGFVLFEGTVTLLSGWLNLESLGSSRRIGEGRSGGWLLTILTGKGPAATYRNLELKLLLRNTRTRASLGMIGFVLILVPLYFAFMAPKFLEYYPLPDQQPASERLAQPSLPEERMITFVVVSNEVPRDAWVYVTGNHTLLGPWRPDRVPMLRINDSTWSRSIPLVQGIPLRFIFTLGTWKTEAFIGAEQEPDVREMTVTGDTTYVQTAPAWKVPSLDGFETFMLLYMAFLLVSMPMLAYGQFLFVWESNYFDLLLSTPIGVPAYLRAKFFLLLGLGMLGLFAGLSTYVIAEELLPIHLAAGLYNLGVNSFLMIFWSTLSKKRMDLSASILSTQGKGGTNFMTILPTMIGPILLFVLANIIFGPEAGLYLLAGLGICGLLATAPLLRLAERVFHTKKYRMRAGFRES